MTLATADASGRPSARMVLLKGIDDRGFVFFTNYESRKSMDLAANPFAALCIHWAKAGEQIRVEGRIERVSDAESDAYFETRGRGSQIGARASRQSAPLPSREALLDRVREIERRLRGRPVPRPEFWGGYRVVPERVEFWVRPGEPPARPRGVRPPRRRLARRAAVPLSAAPRGGARPRLGLPTGGIQGGAGLRRHGGAALRPGAAEAARLALLEPLDHRDEPRVVAAPDVEPHPLQRVAPAARERQVVERVRPAVRARDDVLDRRALDRLAVEADDDVREAMDALAHPRRLTPDLGALERRVGRHDLEDEPPPPPSRRSIVAPRRCARTRFAKGQEVGHGAPGAGARRGGRRPRRARRSRAPSRVRDPRGGEAMKSKTDYFYFETKARRELINVTERVAAVVTASGIREGMVLVSAMHITAGVFVNDHEPGLWEDIWAWLQQLAPRGARLQAPQDRRGQRRRPLKSILVHHQVIVPITAGKLDLGPWQQIFYAEFDGGRRKRVVVKAMGE